jgi:hypothetical protein
MNLPSISTHLKEKAFSTRAFSFVISVSAILKCRNSQSQTEYLNEREEISMKPNTEQVFEYGGYHFVPYRKFRRGEINRPLSNDSRPQKNDARYAVRNMRTDFELGLFSDKCRMGYRADYNYEDFYAASAGNECDIFRCVETGRLYVPGANELFEYTEPRTRGRS